MPKTTSPAKFEEIKRDELSRLFRQITTLRLYIVPVVLVLVAWLLVTPTAAWRRGILVAVGIFAMVVFVHEVVHQRRHGLGRRAFEVNFVFASVGQCLATLATGGLESPFLYAAFPITMASAVILEPWLLLFLLFVQIAGQWLMAWIKIDQLLPHFNPITFGGDAVPGWNQAHVIWMAACGSAGLVIATFLGRGIRRTFDGMFNRGIEAREEILSAHAERTQELAALSGEIAHELKNPLASIKGLSALLAQDAPAGKPSERLEVLRREVDRMQVILDEFLNFSRPLVPLAIETVNLRSLIDEVADMHEGMAIEREVRLLVKVNAESVRCDPRKIKQALINLVQNALEASPADAAVEIEAEAGNDIDLRVLDRGPGIESGLRDKVFEPGVTTKAQGSGLGLTIARALARQHGGDLTLSPREAGGSIATLRLPREARS